MVSLIVFIFNLAAVVAITILAATYSPVMLLWGALPVIAWLAAYALSVEVCLAPRDFWTNPALKITFRKLKFANLTMLCAWVAILVAGKMTGNEVLTGFLAWLEV